MCEDDFERKDEDEELCEKGEGKRKGQIALWYLSQSCDGKKSSEVNLMPIGVTSTMTMTIEEYNRQNKNLQKQQAKDHKRFWKNVKAGYHSMVGIFR